LEHPVFPAILFIQTRQLVLIRLSLERKKDLLEHHSDELLSGVLHPARHVIGHFEEASFQAINCTMKRMSDLNNTALFQFSEE